MNQQSRKLQNGTFFIGYENLWERASVRGRDTRGKFDEICRTSGYSDDVDVYSDLLTRSASEQQKAAGEADTPLARPAARETSIADSKGSGSTPKNKNKQKKTKDRKTQDDSVGNDTSFSDLTPNHRSQSDSRASNTSQADRPDFAGNIPSTRAHMIPNREKSKKGGRPQTCYKYYNVICQAVLGFFSKDSQQLERIAFEMADSDYNFLRAPASHGPYLDTNPCWILVPACPFEEIKTWKPGTPYPFLAVANGFGNKTTEDAYRHLCREYYNEDEDFDETTDPILKRSKCTKSQLDEATTNLRTMVLAMAETLVGRNGEVKPYEVLMKKKLMNENGDFEKRPDHGDQWNKEHYDAELFEATMNSIRTNGAQVPELKGDINENENLDGIELLVFHLNPKQVDLYPDPMLLLVKAAINWSLYCNQKLLPACGDGLNGKVDNDVKEEDEDEEVVVPTTPVPGYIEFMPMPVRAVTPD